MQVLQALNDNGTTLCMVTHDPRYADMATRQLRLLDGEILGEVTVEKQHLAQNEAELA